MPMGRSRVEPVSLFRSAIKYVVLKTLTIFSGRSPWMIREKKAANSSGFANVFDFFSRDAAFDATH